MSHPPPATVPPAVSPVPPVAQGRRTGLLQPVAAGIVAALVGFTSSFAVVLTGLRHVGASADQAASGLLVLCVAMGAGSVVASLLLRMPVTMAWSTPGAALLAGTAAPAGGFPAAVGAFMVCGLLVALCAVVRPLGRAIGAIPAPLASAMLAGVLLSLCIAPFRSLTAAPAAVLPVLLVWLVLLRLARRWAVPGALLAALVVIAVSGALSHLSDARLAPVLEWVAPAPSPAAAVALGIPLFLVTMTSQNIPGMAVLGSLGYRPPLPPLLAYTGLATTAGAVAGAHAVNLAAISAALSAGPVAHPDPERRWIAGVSCGACYLVLGPASAAVAAVTARAPGGLVEAVAGLALIATFASAAAAALADPARRDAAAVTFLVAASGLTIAGVGAALWALVAGGVYLAVTEGLRGGRRGDRRAGPATGAGPGGGGGGRGRHRPSGTAPGSR
ncbi:benzoate/H(+) symporter BenE family transporter [Nakamurella endophytica]|uniref:Benzoate transporter n=1 Tax=Nakamurella endophytica TaxID=1748367 RepID=A0A917T1E3_9ACTN|nr:benzoate/H(+) symporter BenE family transporter [Nakamurella endophytica]GGM06818.1 benzoate transporter [Nakamurella endophytica]